VKPKLQLLFIAAIIILILIGEALVFIPQRFTGASVVIKSYPSTNALIQALSDGEVDMAPLGNIAPQTLLQLKNNTNLNIVPIGNFGFTYIGINLRSSPLNNFVFREAMLYGFDRERVLKYALAGYGELLSPGLFSSAYAALGWKNETVDSYPYDPTEASQLLDSIGFKQASTGVRTDPSTGQRLRTMFIFSKLTDPQAVAAANMFAADMQAIGLPIISFPETDIDFYTQVSVTYYFDLYIETQSANAAPTWLYDLFADVKDMYPAPLSTNLVGYHNSTFEKWSKKLMTASDLSSAQTAALRCQEQLGLDLPALPVYSKNLLIAERKDAPKIIPITGSITETIAATLANMTAGTSVIIGEAAGLGDINPADKLGEAVSLTLRLITEPLLTYGPDGAAQPGLISRWQVSDNATTLTLTLRQGLEFQDGIPTTAHDLAATLNWLTANALPSTSLYPILRTIRNVTEIGDHTVAISFTTSNYFAVYEIGNLFALPANQLPYGDGSLALLINRALDPSGSFTLIRFVQGSEVDLQSIPSAGGLSTLSGVQGLDVAGSTIGGSQVQIASTPFTYEGQSIENATFTVHIYSDGISGDVVHGSCVGFGVYRAILNLNDEKLPIGQSSVITELYAQLPTGAIIQFTQQDLTIHSPQLLSQVILYVLAVATVCFMAYSVTRRKRRRIATKRVRRVRAVRARRQRKKR
jgi:ABC-type transport system substrate-binding protein